jgi:hypothetical protein
MDAKKILRKRDRNRVVGALAYVAGLPLFILVVFIGSIPFMDESPFGSTQYYGVMAAAAVWVAITVFQLLFAAITRNYTARALMTVIATLIIMVGGSVYFDIWAEKKVDAARISYVRDVNGLADDAEVNLDDYEATLPIACYDKQVSYYLPWSSGSGYTGSLISDVEDFCRTYNVGYGSGVSGDYNTDGSKYGQTKMLKADGTPEYWFGETGAVYSDNGLYADGYVFGVATATEIIVTYDKIQAEYKEAGKDADEELAAALVTVENSAEWKNYCKSDVYKAAYGEGGTADSYMISTERLDKILHAFGYGLYNGGIYDLLTNDIIKRVFDVSEYGITEDTFKNLSLGSILEMLNSFGVTFTEDDIMSLIGSYSNYQVCNVLPEMYFIKDSELRTYAYAKYFGETHGANVGSVLIPNSNDRIGGITLTSSGVSASEYGFSLEELYSLRARLSFAPMLYPLFAARRYAYIFAGIAALAFVIFYYTKMKASLIGKRIQALGANGGRN